jgi:lactate dehydrogenase-like 2-hydroxyacid dehydrogenase
MTQPIKVAVLDDYQRISGPIFARLPTAEYATTVFTDTLPAYGHPDTPAQARDALAARLAPFDVVCTMRERTPFPAALVARLPALRLLLTTGVRNAALDLPALRARGVPVAGAGDRRVTRSGVDSTTQHVVALVLAAARNLAQDDADVKRGGGGGEGSGWQTGLAVGLPGKVLGVVGLGRLGVSVARIMVQAFGMRVVAWSQNLTQEAADEKAKGAGLDVEDGQTGEKTFKVVTKEELLKTADIVTLQLVLSDRSRGIIAAKDLALLKPTAIFVNTSRGPLVVESDLLETLEKGRIRSAALDVFDTEPLPTDSKWRTTRWGEDGRSQVLLSPHMGYVEEETMKGWYETQVENILRWRQGEDLPMRLA